MELRVAIVVGLAAMIGGVLWQLPASLDESVAASSQTANTAEFQDLLKQLGKANSAQHNLVTSWLFKPPGARPAIKEPSSKDAGALPVLKLLKVCQAICKLTKFPEIADSKCVGCIALTLPTWSHGEVTGKSNPPLARLPIYESGFTSLAAIPLLFPRRWASFDVVRAAGLTDYAATAEAQTLANDNWQGGTPPDTTWTIGGVTRPSVSKLRAAVPPVCVEEYGWITPASTSNCPGIEKVADLDLDVHFPSLDAAGGEALPLAFGSAETYRAISQDLTREAFKSAKGAAAAAVDSMQTSYSTTIFFRNVSSPERLKHLAELYGAEWEPLGADAIAADGDLVEVDLMYAQGVKSTAPPAGGATGPWWNVAAHALFRVVGGGSHGVDLEGYPHDEPATIASHGVTFEPVAILLSNQPSDPDAKLVFTPAKSESAYIIAALALRQAAVQAAIWVGHVYSLHIQSAAATVALYNTVDSKSNVYYSTHPIRQILDFFADPTYVSEFHSSLFVAGYSAGPGTSAGVPDLFSLWNAYAQRGIVHKDTSWAGSTVPSQLAASGLSEERFRGGGAKGSFAALPAISMNLALRRKVVAPYATAVVEAAYASDAAVAADAELQSFAVALTAPHGSNLVRINDAGSELKTKAQLAKFIEDYVTIILTHGSAHLQDYSMRVLNVALNPPRLGEQQAPKPDGQYSEADYLRWIPTTGSAARQYTFVSNFVGTTMLPATNLVASQQFLKGAAPSWGDGVPYYTGPNARDVSEAHQEFIRKASDFQKDWPRSHGLRAVATNFQYPTRLPRVINI